MIQAAAHPVKAALQAGRAQPRALKKIAPQAEGYIDWIMMDGREASAVFRGPIYFLEEAITAARLAYLQDAFDIFIFCNRSVLPS